LHSASSQFGLYLNKTASCVKYFKSCWEKQAGETRGCAQAITTIHHNHALPMFLL